ncbi:MAG: hypothetical protein FJ248_00160 [Nitrospira sp.]|nr:hypothetical protein [Nitrospira sp.]
MHTQTAHAAFAVTTLLLMTMIGTPESAQASPTPPPMSDSTATTELNCSFGMGKGEAGQNCQVPIPPGCAVAHLPGTTKPWTNISKGGNTICKFDDKATNWKTRIIGTCGKCKTDHCSVQFIVKFDCSQRK